MEYQGFTFTPVPGGNPNLYTYGGQQYTYNPTEGQMYVFGGSNAGSKFNASNPSTPTPLDGATGGTPPINASDFASWSGLPSWGSSAVQRATDPYADPVFANYQSSIDALDQAPANTEAARKASQSQFMDTTQKNLAEASRQANATMSARGTADSSIGSDYVAALANSAIASAQQQQGVNVAAQEADYQNLVDKTAATQGFTSTIGGLLGNSKETFNPNYPGLDFDPGAAPPPLTNQDGNGSWTSTGGLNPDGTYGNHYTNIMGGAWEPPPEFQDMGGGQYSYAGQTFGYDTATGKLTNISSGGAPPLLDSADMASRAGLEDFASATTQRLVDTYSDPAMAGAYDATAALQAAGAPGGQIEGDAAGLNQQYGDLSAETLAMLNSAMTTAGIPGAAAPGYNAANQAAITNAAQAGKSTVANQTAGWEAGMKNKNLTDSASANQAMAKIIGDYLGLARYSYDPNYDKYLSYSQQ